MSQELRANIELYLWVSSTYLGLNSKGIWSNLMSDTDHISDFLSESARLVVVSSLAKVM